MNMLKEINYVLEQKEKIRLIFLLCITIIGALLELVGVTVILPFVNAIVSPNELMGNKYIQMLCAELGLTNMTQVIILLSGVLIVIYVLKNSYIVFMTDRQYRFVYGNQRRLADRMMKCYISQPYLYHHAHGSAELVRNLDVDVKNFFSVVISLLHLFTELCVCLVLVVFLAYKDKSITLGVCIVLALFLAVYMSYIRRKVSVMGSETRDCLEAMTKDVLQAFGGIKEVKILGKEDFFTDIYDRHYAVYADRQTKYFIYGLVPRPLMETVCVAGMMLIIVLKLLNGTAPVYFIPTISVFAVAAFRMLPSFSRITNEINNIMYQKASMHALYRELTEMEKFEDRTAERNDGKELFFEKEVKVDNIDFRYPDSDQYVLKGASLTIPKNRSVALIGPSGEGKTTLADIILGLLEVEKGKVLLDGADIQENMSCWRKKLGYIPQAIYLTDDSIRNNVAYGVDEKEIDEARFWKALEDAQIKDFVESLEKGADTVVGERGVRLSGGQRQRIGIARALYTDPEILILDEATSALDNDTEAAVMEAINHLAGSKTLLIIAHRLSTIQNCDVIYEVKGQTVRQVEKPVGGEHDSSAKE